MKTSADYIPLIDIIPSDSDTIMTALSNSYILTTEYVQNITVFTSDLQLYRIGVSVARDALNSLVMLF